MTESGWHPAEEDECVNLLYQDSYLTAFVFKGIFSRPTSKPCIYIVNLSCLSAQNVFICLTSCQV